MTQKQPPLLDFAEACNLLRKLFNTKSLDVSVFYDAGWGSSPAQVSIVLDGNGQGPLAYVTLETYERLQAAGVVGPNNLRTFKARRSHPYVGEGAVAQWLPRMYGVSRRYPKLSAAEKDAVLAAVAQYVENGADPAWKRNRDGDPIAPLPGVGLKLTFGWAMNGGRYLADIRRSRSLATA